MFARYLNNSQHIRLSRFITSYSGREPISPFRQFLSTSSTHANPIKKHRILKGFGYLALGTTTIYIWDRHFNASAISRNFRTLYMGAIVGIDYKLNFNPGHSEEIMALHERVADRIFNLLTDNGGLYIKMGQALAANVALLPPPFKTRFNKLFDDAPQVPYADIEKVFISQFGKPPMGENGVFEVFEEKAVASASIAQVHRAKLKNDHPDGGRWVAVKVQKPAVSTQVEWDLAAFKALMWMYENWFPDMPAYFLVDFISSHLRLELDFLNEAHNAQRTATLIAAEPKLASKVYVPKVYNEYTTRRVMTAEYIDGVKLSDRQAVQRLLDGAASTIQPDPAAVPNWDGASSPSYSSKPIRGGARAIMETVVSLFSAQIFEWGFVHCDPHPGNIIIRRQTPSNEPQIVLIDHGLYVQMSDELRKEYALLWKGLLGGDMSEIREVAVKWGIGKESLDLLANGVLLGPWRAGPKSQDQTEKKPLSQYEKSLIMKEKLKQFLTDTEQFPKALIFLGRNMRIVQGNNQALGSPVNRVKIIGHWASRSLARAPNLSISQRLLEYWHHTTYVVVIFALDVSFWLSKLRRWARGGSGSSFEDEIEEEMRRFSKENFGVELGESAFMG